MPNFIQSVGADFFNRKFAGSFFIDDAGRPSEVVSTNASGSRVNYNSHAGSSSRVVSTSRDLPADFFTSMEIFSVPILGWRMRDKGRYIAFFSRNNRSYHRGLNAANLSIGLPDFTRWMNRTGNTSTNLRAGTKCVMALKPEFIPFTEGVQKMRDGEIMSFAASPTVAVMPDEDDKFAIYFRQTKAGEVAADGTVVLDIPFLAEYVGELR